jgi:hypothetical protein
VSCAGRGDFSASFGGAGSVDCRSGRAGGFAGAFALVRDFCSDGLPDGFFFESIFGADGPADSFDTDAVRVAFGFGVSARGAEAVEAAVDAAVAIGALSGLIICEAADGAAVFEAPAIGGVESCGAGLGGAVAIGGPFGLIACKAANGAAVFGASATGGVESCGAELEGAVAIGGPFGLIACEAADGAAVFGASVRGGVESGAAGVDGAVAIGAPSGPIRCEATSVAAWFSGAGAKAGTAEPGALAGSRVCSFCGVARRSVAATEGSRSARSGALFMRTKLAQTAATPASASPPAVSFQCRELGQGDF